MAQIFGPTHLLWLKGKFSHRELFVADRERELKHVRILARRTAHCLNVRNRSAAMAPFSVTSY